jgi:predicted nucleic acid-binding protein
VGTLIDTSAIIAAERGGALPVVELDEEVGISSITASELLLGTHEGSPQERARRTAYVEEVLERLPVVPFGLVEARVHAAVTATMQAMGLTTATADMQIAASVTPTGLFESHSTWRTFPLARLWSVQDTCVGLAIQVHP